MFVMYEEKKIRFDWKGFLIKFALLILVVILVIKLLPFNKNTDTKAKSESFISNLNKLKNTANDFFAGENLPQTVGESKTITLEDLENTGKISELKDKNGNNCNIEKSYIKATKKEDEFIIISYLICGNEKDKVTSYKQNENK